MPFDRADVLGDINAVLEHRPPQGGTEGIVEVATMIKACISRWAPGGSVYRRLADAIDPLQLRSSDADGRLRGVLLTLRRDYSAGVIGTVDQIGHAAILDDLLRQADQLLRAGFRCAAAVVGGAALETQLRQLASRLDVDIETPDARGVMQARTAQAVNDDLGRVPAYPAGDARLIQLWLAMRDRASHGGTAPEAISGDDLRSMLEGIRTFMRHYPA